MSASSARTTPIEALELRRLLSGEYLYVTDWDNHTVLRYDAATGAFVDEFVRRKSGGLNDPIGLLIGPNDGNLYVASGQFSGNGEVTGVLRYDGGSGQFLDVFADGQHLTSPRGIIFGSDGDLFVADFSTSDLAGRVVRFDGASGAFEGEFVPPGYGGLGRPVAVLFGPDVTGDGALDLYVQSAGTSTILHYDGISGAFLGPFVPTGSAGMDHPTGMVFGPDGNLYVANWTVGTGHMAVLRYAGPASATPGAPLPAAGNSGADFVPPGSGGLQAPNGLIFGPDANGDGAQDLYVTSGKPTGSYKAKMGTGTIKRYDAVSGAFIDTFITSGSGGLRGPFYLIFNQTDPVTLEYSGAATTAAASAGSRGVGIGPIAQPRPAVSFVTDDKHQDLFENLGLDAS